MSLPTGVQDHFPALLGGALEIEYRPGGESVRNLGVDLEALRRQRAGGLHRAESFFGWQQLAHRSETAGWRRGDHRALRWHPRYAREVPQALEEGDWESAGKLVAQEWGYRSRLAEGISTPEIEDLLAAAEREGAWGGKACGAGGGGCIVLLCPAERRRRIAEVLAAAGARFCLPGRWPAVWKLSRLDSIPAGLWRGRLGPPVPSLGSSSRVRGCICCFSCLAWSLQSGIEKTRFRTRPSAVVRVRKPGSPRRARKREEAGHDQETRISQAA